MKLKNNFYQGEFSFSGKLKMSLLNSGTNLVKNEKTTEAEETISSCLHAI